MNVFSGNWIVKHRALMAALLYLLVLTPVFGEGRAIPKFVDITKQSGLSFVNDASSTSQKYLPETMVGGVAMFDYDGDGRLDLFFVNGAKLDDPMTAGKAPDKSDSRYWNRLYRNNGDGTFTDARAEVSLVSESGARQHATVSAGSSYLSSSDKRTHFGLGADKRIKLLQIKWPSGVVQRIEDVAADQMLTIREPFNRPLAAKEPH